MIKRRFFHCMFLLSLFLGSSISNGVSTPRATALAEPYFSSPFPGESRLADFGIVSSPAFPSLLLAAQSFGYFPSISKPRPFYSLDGGVFWNPTQSQPWESDPDFESITSMAIAPRPDQANTPRILVSIGTYSVFEAGVVPVALFSKLLYRSGNLGNSWVAVSLPVDEVFRNACSSHWSDTFHTYLVASPADPGRLYFTVNCRNQYGEPGDPSWSYSSIYSSFDSGVTWNLLHPRPLIRYTDGKILKVSPILPQRVYMIDYSMGLQWLQSDDAGETWFPTNITAEYSILELDAQDPLKLYTYHSRSSDGGAHWVDWAENPCSDAYDLIFPNPLLADTKISDMLYIQCTDDTYGTDELYTSTDGGDHWENRSVYRYFRLDFDLGNPGRLLQERPNGLWASADQGITWAHVTDNYTNPPFLPWENITPTGISISYPVRAHSGNNVWTANNKYWDGNMWKSIEGYFFQAADFLSPDSGWLVGGYIQRWRGQSLAEGYAVSAYLDAVDMVSENDAWAVGYTDPSGLGDGKIYHWDGSAWNETYSVPNWPLHRIKMVSADEGWAFGQAGIILHWKDQQWSVYEIRDNLEINDAEMLSATNGWLVGATLSGESVILHWDGTGWQNVDHPQSGQLNSIDFQASDDGWAAGGTGGKGMLLHWDGIKWTDAGLSSITEFDDAFTLPNGDFWLALPDRIFRYREGYFQQKKIFLPVVLR